MAGSTGPILLAGTITFANGWIFNKQGPNFKVILATGIAAGGLALLDHASPPLATGIAWIALITVLFTRVGGKESPAENAVKVTGL
jgi:hypothetical protein